MKNSIAKTTLAFAAIFAAWQPHSPAEDYKGADAILKTLDAVQVNAPPAPPAFQLPDSAAALRAGVEYYRADLPKLAPADAAKGWLDLAVHFVNYDTQNTDAPTEAKETDPFDFYIFADALPPPSAWDELMAQGDRLPPGADDRHTFRILALKLLLHEINNDAVGAAQCLADLDALQAKMKPNKPADDHSYPINQTFLDRVRQHLAGFPYDNAIYLKQLNDGLSAPVDNNAPVQTSFLPDLLRMEGKEKTAAYLRKALVRKVDLDIQGSDEMFALAREVALDVAPDLTAPQWRLTLSTGPDARKLYETMLKRFPAPDNNLLCAPTLYYICGLLEANRMEEANAAAAGIQWTDTASRDSGFLTDLIDELDANPRARDFVDFFHDQLARNPKLPFWSYYTHAAPRVGRGNEMFTLFNTLLARKDIDDDTRRIVEDELERADLAADKIDDALAILRKRGKSETVNIIKIAEALGRKDVLSAQAAIFQHSAEVLQVKETRESWGMVNLCLELGLPHEAETAVAYAASHVDDPNTKRDLQFQLVVIYHEAHRPADVLAVLDGGPFWGQEEMDAEFMDGRLEGHDHEPFGYYVADALAATGRKEAAKKITDALIDNQPGCDPACELLLQIEPREEALARLDALAARDPLDPHPLFWKAKALLDAKQVKQLETAEAAARRAIAVDPPGLDGNPNEQGNVEIAFRSRAYDLLADIRAARGDKKEAASLRAIAAETRLAGNAGTLASLGLRTHAIKAYKDALAIYGGDFRAQFNLARLIEETGDMAGATEQYHRACALLPAASDGLYRRNRYYCLLPAFPTPLSRSVAEEVLSTFVKQHPDDARTHYLLGCLRIDQKRPDEALAGFREAVRLDPDYFDAWRKLGDLAAPLNLPAAQRDATLRQLVRLDPLGRHYDYMEGDPRDFDDVKTAWDTVETARKLQPPQPKGSFYTFTASAEELKRNPPMGPPVGDLGGPPENEHQESGNAVCRNWYFDDIISLVDSSRKQLFPSR